MVKKSGLILLFLLSLSAAARGAGTDFDALPQCTQGAVKAWMFFTIGQASLHRQHCHADDPLAPPLRLTFGYNRDVPGDAFRKSANAMIKRNVSASRYNQLKERLTRFDSHYRDTRDGDQYTLDYDTDQSLVLKLNGETLATEHGADFAHAYFTIWFGDDPFSDDLKADLLPDSR